MLYKSAFLSCQKNVLKALLCCHICNSSVAQSKSSARYAKKFLLQSEGKKKRTWHDSRLITSPSDFVEPKDKRVKNVPRLRILNKVFLNKITEIMSTGEVSDQLSGFSLEISEVRVLPNLQGINVHWLCPETNVDEMESVLMRNSRAIRHELSQLRVLGHVPPITFVKDYRYKKLQEVERLLSVADFGEDAETSQPAHVLSTPVDNSDEETTNTVEVKSDSPSSEIFRIMSDLHVPLTEELGTDVLPPDLPPMRYDVLGVDTQKIYTKILQRLKQTRADHRKNSEKQAYSSSSKRVSDTHSVSYSPQEIHRWVGQYKLQHKKDSYRKNNEKSILSMPSDHSAEYEEEIEYIEDEFMEEFDSCDEFDSTLKP